ncbi:MAG: phenylacetate-CoA oxygenase subunit PaaC [Bacteroidetes bacterium]|nr:phenylacetate-CoA oxygenase subunit PaaC [Bacteroidota bacterium]
MKTKDALIEYCTRLADNNLILGQRLAEWCSKGPILEEDLAMTNISLDLFGQAEAMYEYISELKDKKMNADQLAFLRSERQYLNNVLVELPNGDFAYTMAKLFLYSSFAKPLYMALSTSNDEVLKGLAEKALKEVKYHWRHSSEWLIRFGQGTVESKMRAQHALNDLWKYTSDMFEMNEVDEELISTGIGTNLKDIYNQWDFTVTEIISEAGLEKPTTTNAVVGGNKGFHTEHLGHILCEMQYLQRAYPGSEW